MHVRPLSYHHLITQSMKPAVLVHARLPLNRPGKVSWSGNNSRKHCHSNKPVLLMSLVAVSRRFFVFFCYCSLCVWFIALPLSDLLALIGLTSCFQPEHTFWLWVCIPVNCLYLLCPFPECFLIGSDKLPQKMWKRYLVHAWLLIDALNGVKVSLFLTVLIEPIPFSLQFHDRKWQVSSAA